jgi:membrane protease YdiL (CAAX protease family)
MSTHPPRSNRILSGALVYSAGFLLLALWRHHAVTAGDALGPSTAGLVAWTVAGVLLLPRLGVDLRRLGFNQPIRGVHFGLAAAGIGIIVGVGLLLGSVLQDMFDLEADLSRFATSVATPGGGARLILYSWVFGAVGEEIAFRATLMPALSQGFGAGRVAVALGVILQAVVFGMMHYYQGWGGVLQSGASGLVYGGLVLAARGSLWPAVLAHGGCNTISILVLAS